MASLNNGNDYSQVVGTSPVPLIPAFAANGCNFMRIFNVSASGGPNLWISRATSTPAANTAGCIQIPPGQYEDFSRVKGSRPPGAVYAVADAAGCQVTAEAY